MVRIKLKPVRRFWSLTEVLLDMVALGSELGWLKWPDENGVSNLEKEILKVIPLAITRPFLQEHYIDYSTCKPLHCIALPRQASYYSACKPKHFTAVIFSQFNFQCQTNKF